LFPRWMQLIVISFAQRLLYPSQEKRTGDNFLAKYAISFKSILPRL